MFEADREYPSELLNLIRSAMETRLELNKFHLKHKKSAKVGPNLSIVEALENKEQDAWAKATLLAKEHGITQGTIALHIGVLQEIDPDQYEKISQLAGIKGMGRVKNSGGAYEIEWE